MFRKTITAVAAAAAIGAAALAPATASAAPGHHGGHSFHGTSHGHVSFHRGGHGHVANVRHFGHSFHRASGLRVLAPLYGGCWRWVPGRFGLVKVWVCD